MFSHPPSLTLRFSLLALRREPSKRKTLLCSTGVFRLDTQGEGRLLTPLQSINTKPSIWHCSLGNTSSALQGKSLTALILAGNSPQLLGLIIQVTPKSCATNLQTIMLPTCLSNWWRNVARWSSGRLVGGGEGGLRHWTVASRGCDSISKAHHASFFCHSKATSPSVYRCRVHY